ncbi:MAG: hypothetical protein F8N39_11535 [Clostridiaceae bacterium]|nr:hypothetical protein [Clostridiaceae bacterium]
MIDEKLSMNGTIHDVSDYGNKNSTHCIGQGCADSDTVCRMTTLPDLPTQHERLQWAANQAGCKSAAELARFTGKEEPTVRSNLNGHRTFSRPSAIDYGKKLDVPWAWLLEGNRENESWCLLRTEERHLVELFSELPAAKKTNVIETIEALIFRENAQRKNSQHFPE